MQPSIYAHLAEHQSKESVPNHELLTELHRMAELMIDKFKLRVENYVIGIGRLRINRLGQYRYQTNDFGLRSEILIAERHVRRSIESGEPWRIFGTLLHELDHGWQELHGKPGKGKYHNREFRRKAADQGLIVDQRGYTQYDNDSPFTRLLEREGFQIPTLPEPKLIIKQPAGKSTLSKWTCSCVPPQIVRVGKSVFEAVCTRCNCHFRPSH